MSVIYTTRAGDTVDSIVWKYYGDTLNGKVEAVLKANHGLATMGAALPAGVIVTLPDLPTPATSTGVRLWS